MAVRDCARRLSGDLQLTPWLHLGAEYDVSDRSADEKLRVGCFWCANKTEARENDDADEAVILETDGGNDAVQSLKSVDENRNRDADVAICMSVESL